MRTEQKNHRTAAGGWEVRVDRERCAGSGMCVLTAPALFDQDPGDGRVVVLNPRSASEGQRSAEEAAEGCPSGAIRVVPDAGE